MKYPLSDRAFLMHDVFLEMQLNGARVEERVFLKAFVGAASEYGGARPWESQLIHDAMRRSGTQIRVRLVPLRSSHGVCTAYWQMCLEFEWSGTCWRFSFKPKSSIMPRHELNSGKL